MRGFFLKRLIECPCWSAAAIAAVLACLVTAIFVAGLQNIPSNLGPGNSEITRTRFLARDGSALSWTRENRWNVQDVSALHAIPDFLVKAVVRAEDKRFFSHFGNDPVAIASAVLQNIRNGRVVRGASTISEQVIKLLHPRPRSILSRVYEMIEARVLENRFSKSEILEFYLNQSPYPMNTRGVASASRELFNRDISTLSKKEMLALAVMLRAPSRLGPSAGRSPGNPLLDKEVARLASLLVADGALEDDELQRISDAPLTFERRRLRVHASHFLGYARTLRGSMAGEVPPVVQTTINPALQEHLQKILDVRLKGLAAANVNDGAILVVDNETGEILAWVTARDGTPDGSGIDGVTIARQPGSALKPFLYSLALERGWTAATLIDDSPLLRPVGSGLKEYRNYSGVFHGPVRLRDALGNSLNIPAIRTAEAVGKESFYRHLRDLGFESLKEDADFYGDGLALGNGEVTLFELTRAYAALANRGVFRPLRAFLSPSDGADEAKRVMPEQISSIIGNILSDPDARSLEFSRADLSRFSSQVAIKTGTSSGYHDAWAIGYSSRHTVGIWLGNFNRKAMTDVTGSSGPLVVLQAAFSWLGRTGQRGAPLFFSHELVPSVICRETGTAVCLNSCSRMTEWFLPGTVPRNDCGATVSLSMSGRNESKRRPSIALPTDGLHLAQDPRIPRDLQKFPLTLASWESVTKAEWLVDGERFAVQHDGRVRVMWPVTRGRHVIEARVWTERKAGPEEAGQARIFVR